MLEFLLDELKEGEKLTTNGAKVLATTGDSRLDFFAELGSMRRLSREEIIQRFNVVFKEYPLDALKLLMYCRDRNMVGERNTARVILRYLANNHSDIYIKNMSLIAHFGRWDDLILTGIGTNSEEAMIGLIKEQLELDLKTKYPSLLGKWMPSINTSSDTTRKVAIRLSKRLGMNCGEYRKLLSKLRNKINIVETYMSSNKWSEIEYSKLTSKNNLLYANAFSRHDSERYDKYIEEVISGKAKINTSKLFPYEIVRKCINDTRQREVMNTLWDKLPNYLPENLGDTLVVCDTSGSMTCSMRGIKPIDVALALTLYFGERNTGIFNNYFMTFSKNPQLVKIQGRDLYEKIINISRADWGMNTNLEGVYELLLNTSIKNNLKQEDMVKRIVIISDMNIDACTYGSGRKLRFMDEMRRRFNEAGYEMPKCVFWNVESSNTSFLASKDDEDMSLMSGASASLFKAITKGNTPMEMLREMVLENEIYSNVRI